MQVKVLSTFYFNIDSWCNGSTGGFEPSSLGSNPSELTNYCDVNVSILPVKVEV